MLVAAGISVTLSIGTTLAGAMADRACQTGHPLAAELDKVRGSAEDGRSVGRTEGLMVDVDGRFASVNGTFVDLGAGRRAYVAEPAGAGPHPGVILIQEAFGVNGYIQSEVRRLAEAGYVCIAPDLYRGRILEYADRGEAAEAMKTQPDAFMMGEIGAAAASLDARADVLHTGYGVVGFCMGGRLAFLTAAELGPRVRAAAIFYGGGIAPEVATRRPALGHRVADVTARLLFNYGADDASILPAEHARLAEALSTAKIRYTIDVYDGAPHAFANAVRESYRPAAAASAWAATLRLFGETLGASA